ncbi:MAG: hypothetical protein CVU24_10335 [Betaproteobacteria bacterium HGW-Betaproteobacteria-18]|nr:MAG: hypothetical protein CVU24_10335 [Betaproteobacteria bacterium HGW-Betaproteobacteria-18]
MKSMQSKAKTEMTDKSSENREWVSALVDGQLRGDEFAQALAHLARSSEARQTWHAYHVVGDVMRSGQAAVSAHDADLYCVCAPGCNKRQYLWSCKTRVTLSLLMHDQQAFQVSIILER